MRGRRWLLIFGLVVVGLANTAASCDEDPPDVSFTFVNGTDRNLTYLVSLGGGSFESVADRTLKLPPTVPPGDEINTAAPAPSVAPADGEPWCPGAISYYFISPIDPAVTSPRSPTTEQPDFDIAAVELIQVLEAPCWPAKAGNTYTVTGDAD